MIKKINFKYDIGDTVKLAKAPLLYASHVGTRTDFREKEYKVNGFRYVYDESGEKVQYQLYAYWDDYLDYDNWLTEDCLLGDGTPHDEEIKILSADFCDLELGDHVYSGIYYGRENETYISPMLTFFKEFEITGLSFEVTEKNKVRKFVVGSRKGAGVYNFSEQAALLLKEPDDKFVEEYIKACKRERLNPFSIRNKHDSDHCKACLESMGVYDQVKSRYKSVTIKSKKKSENCETEVDKILAGLSNEQKGEMYTKLIKDIDLFSEFIKK